VELAVRVPGALLRHGTVEKVELVGSRAAGTAVTLSDWDFLVETNDFDAVAQALPQLVEPLRPLARQWDPLGEHPCYMLMLTGAIKVDLIFDRPHEPAPPWVVTAETLPRIDAHFWDWVLWLGAKRAAGKHALIESELDKLSAHILAMLGVEERLVSLEDAVGRYRPALRDAEERLGVRVSPRVGAEVRTRLGL
jgi:hypothetical protein